MVDLVVLEPLSSDGWRSKHTVKGLVGATDSESEYRLQTAEARRTYEIPFEDRTVDKWTQYRDFHLLRGGVVRGFLLWDLYSCFAQAQRIGTGDGATASFQLATTISDAATSVSRKITKPVPTGTALPVNVAGVTEVLCGVGLTSAPTTIAVSGSPRTEGSQFTVDPATGLVHFASPPATGAPVVWTGFYYTPVRFQNPEWDMTLSGVLGSTTPPLIEVLNE